MPIPKIIHTCWFGGAPKGDAIERYLASQRRVLPDYKHLEWSEKTIDLEKFPFLKNAWELKKYAHVSDMVRLIVLHRHGGIYMDTDVEVCRSLDDLLGADLFCGYIWECMLGTAVLGSAPNHPIIESLLDDYIKSPDNFPFNMPNNHHLTRHFIDNVPGFRLNGRAWDSNGIRILDRYAFEQPSFGRRKNYTLHHFSASWKKKSKLNQWVKSFIVRTVGLYIYRQYNCSASLRGAGYFREEYERVRANS